MPEIQAFRGLRYDLGHVGSLSDVVAPPYDVIGPELQDELYKKHPANVVRLILNRDEPGDDEANNRYTRAAQFLKNWRERRRAVRRSRSPAFTSITRCSTSGGQTFTRRGFMARVRLERFGEGKIFPHEETLSGPKQDRLMLTRACKANLSQIFGLYPDPEVRPQNLLEEAIAGADAARGDRPPGRRPPPVAGDRRRRRSRPWPGVMGPKPMFIADGHHRYETACNYRDELVATSGPLDADHPANFVLMMCVGMSDPGMIVLPTHRLFRGAAGLTADN